IIKKTSLFVGVGAAHLPGRRGVIEMLRDKGYRLRPVSMDERNSAQKEAIDKLHLPYHFKQQSSADGIYKVSIPGEKFYRFTNWSGMDIVQFADMVNGTYYMVNRIKTNSLFYGDNVEVVQKKVDSLLYENIPGKILKKTTITKNGYKGLDIMNRTRRGDYQRYNIFVTPFEVIIFKMSGNGEYVNIAEDAQQFFNSIRLQEYPQVNWQHWQPATGGFSVRVPHQPLTYRDKNYGTDRMEYIAADKEKGNTYLIMKANLHNYSYFEEDSFELNLLSESYSYSPFISRELNKKFINLNGYPALDCQYLHKDGTFSKARFVIQGPIYYVLITKFKSAGNDANDFIESFKIMPFKYPEAQKLRDTAMHFSVRTPSFKKEMDEEEDSKNKMQELIRLAYRGDEDDDLYQSQMQMKTRVFGNDTIGERIFVTFNPMPDYGYIKDSTTLWELADGEEWLTDTSFVVKLKKESMLPNGFRRMDLQLTDTGSSKLLISTSFYKNGKFFTISTLTDTLSKRSSFIEEFITSFNPDDSLKGSSPFTRKTGKFFSDFFSTDSLVAKSARRAAYQISFDSLDVPLLLNGIDSLNWNTKNYLYIKKNWIAQLGYLKHPLIVPYLNSSYLKVGDTVELQHSVLNALLAQRTKESFIAFKNLMLQEPPIADEGDDSWTLNSTLRMNRTSRLVMTDDPRVHYGTWGELYDTLALTKGIFPDFLQLINIDDYKGNVMHLLTTLVDSGYLKAEDYESYFGKIYLDAKQILKKQVAREEKEKIEKASRKDKPMSTYYPGWDYEVVNGAGNSSLHQYSILLLPFWEKNPGVPAYFKQLLNTEDRKLLYETFILLVRNNKPVPDSLFQKFASLDEYRSDLYRDLQKMKKIEKFPAAFKKQELVARSLLINSSGFYGKLDTLVFVDKLPLTYKNKKGFVYFFKYKKMMDDMSWELASVGMQPEDITQVDVVNDDFTELEKRKLENDQPIREQLEKVLKELLYQKRASAYGFYEGRAMNMYRNFLPDMVKSNRYRD
ncbi:MAG TPA: TraB/GumN family protein, partial [Chitinophagaceae bacterium]|nr:TraB/GumN family protein [Chitinophagaceae bacterium]